MKKAVYIFLVFSITSCFTPDEYLPKIDSEKINISLNSTESPSTFIKLGFPTGTLSKEKSNWQLRFENTADEWGIYTNPTEPIRIFNTKINRYDLINLSSIDGNTIWEYDDVKSTNIKSAIGRWGDFDFPNPESYKDVYILNWTQDSQDYYYKFQILDADINTYHFKYGPLNETSFQIETINKQEVQLYSYFSLVNNEQVKTIEPNTNEWHIHFSYQVDSINKHTKIPYSSTSNSSLGLFPSFELNHEHVEIFLDTLMNFEQINYINSRNLTFEKSKNSIGLFYQKDAMTSQLQSNSKQNLILRSDDEYYVIRALNIIGSSVGNHSVTFEIKKL